MSADDATDPAWLVEAVDRAAEASAGASNWAEWSDGLREAWRYDARIHIVAALPAINEGHAKAQRFRVGRPAEIEARNFGSDVAR